MNLLYEVRIACDTFIKKEIEEIQQEMQEDHDRWAEKHPRLNRIGLNPNIVYSRKYLEDKIKDPYELGFREGVLWFIERCKNETR